MHKKATEIGGIPEHVMEEYEEWDWVLIWDLHCLLMAKFEMVKPLHHITLFLYVVQKVKCLFYLSRRSNGQKTLVWRCGITSQLCYSAGSLLLTGAGFLPPFYGSLVGWVVGGVCHTSVAPLKQAVTLIWLTWSETYWKLIIWSSSLNLDLCKAWSSIK